MSIAFESIVSIVSQFELEMLDGFSVLGDCLTNLICLSN